MKWQDTCQNFIPVLPPLKTRVEPRQYDRETYKRRNEVERLCRRLKGHRRIFSRFETLDVMFLGFVSFVPITDGLRLCQPALAGSASGWWSKKCAADLRRQWASLAKICQVRETAAMSTMNISLPEALKSFVDEQVSLRGYGTSSEYVRELIRKEQDRQQLRGLLLAGAASVPAPVADAAHFDALRQRVRGAIKAGRRA